MKFRRPCKTLWPGKGCSGWSAFDCTRGQDENALKSAAQKLLGIKQKLDDYRQHLQASYDFAQTLAAGERKRLDQGHLNEDERRWSRQKQAAYETRADFYVRSLENINRLTRLAERFQEEIVELRRKVALQERLNAYLENR